ncbi:MAG: marine proteobacterial sortase target protein [Gammaproteobacteria bacterium]
MLHPSPRSRFPHWDLLLSILMLIVMVIIMSPAHASERYTRADDVGAGQLLVKDAGGWQALLTLSTRYDVQVSGLQARLQLQQTFRNDSADWVEADYVFPLQDNAAVSAMDIRIGERIIQGRVKEREQARQEYVQARAQGQRAGLVEQQRPNLFTSRVANIGPGETVTVNLTVIQPLHYDQGRVELRLPTTLTPRYIPGAPAEATSTVLQGSGWAFATDAVADAPAITPPQTRSVGADSHQASIHIDLQPGFVLAQLDAPYHRLSQQQHGDRYQIQPDNGAITMDRDFVLRWAPVPQQAPVAAVFHETVNDQAHAMLMVLPPVDETALVIPPRELILIIDTSGSMAGVAMPQAQQALDFALQQLRPEDAFNVIEFNSDFQLLFNDVVKATADNLQQARRFVSRLRADGGTEMLPALQAAFDLPNRSEFLRQIVFITDGSVGNENALFQLIEQRIGNDRLYTVGIGSAPNQYFMRKAASAGRGTFTLIGAQNEVQQQMQTLFDKIRRPVLTSVQLDTAGRCDETYPNPLPDLFAGEPLLVHLRCSERPQQIHLTGTFQQQPWQTRLHTHPDQPDSAGIATLWARAKVTHLQDVARQTGDAQAAKADIIQVGLDYQIITPFTSFIAVEQVIARPEQTPLRSEAVPSLMPQGAQQLAPGVGYPATALDLEWHWLLGLLCALAALLVWQRCEFRPGECAC